MIATTNDVSNSSKSWSSESDDISHGVGVGVGGASSSRFGFSCAAIATSSIIFVILASTLTVLDRVRYNNIQHEAIQELLDQVNVLQERTDVLTDLLNSKAGKTDLQLQLSGHREVQESSCECSLPNSYTYAASYGVVGDGQTDDGPALQAAIDVASSSDMNSGGIVILPPGVFRTSTPLTVPGGITLQGMGYGSSPLAVQFDAGSSTIAYCGTDYAVKLVGHSASLRDLAIYDWNYDGCEDVKAAGGILVEGKQTLVESVTVSNVLVYFFLGGAALSLVARESGGVGMGNYQNLRIRHSGRGIYLSADETSFVNSNAFIGGMINGAVSEAGIYAEGPGACNDNKFFSMNIEPPETSLAHVFVTGPKTNLKLLDVRLEGTDMFAQNKPLVIIDDSSYGNVMTGMLGHTHVQANLNRNPGIDLMSAKSVGLDPVPVNMFWNSAFKGWDEFSRSLPGFALVGTNANILVLGDEEMMFPDHKVISIDYLNFGGPFKLQADTLPKAPGHDFVTFGIFARCTVPGSIAAAMRYESGSIIASAQHSGSGDWEFIGMSALYDKVNPYFYFSITGDVDLTAPTLTYGETPATPGASLMSSSGAKMSGTLTMGISTVFPPPSATPYYWTLPRNGGNLFLIDVKGDPNRSIIRLNHVGADWFPRGAVVTLMFSLAGTLVKHNVYIELKNSLNFVTGANTSISLMSNGNGTWREVSRNN